MDGLARQRRQHPGARQWIVTGLGQLERLAEVLLSLAMVIHVEGGPAGHPTHPCCGCHQLGADSVVVPATQQRCHVAVQVAQDHRAHEPRAELMVHLAERITSIVDPLDVGQADHWAGPVLGG